MINTTNIRGYINYLYLQRNGSNAPQDLLNKWATLPNTDIGIQLQKLYASWGMTLDASNAYEKQYTDAILAALPQAAPTFTPQASTIIQPHQTLQERPYVPPAKSSSTNTWIVAIALLAIIACGAAWILNSNKKTTTANVTPIENNEPSAPVIATQEAPTTTVTPPSNAPVDADSLAIAQAKQHIANSATATEQASDAVEEAAVNYNNTNLSETDKRNINNIQQLMAAEEQRDFNTIYDYYSPNIERYWDIEYPTRDELQTRFTKVWKKSTNPKHSNVTVTKLADNKYIATGVYEYYHVASSTTKTVNFKNSFTFDNNGKIIETNEAK